MSSQIVTQYGPLGRRTGLAVQLVISRTANKAVVALTTVHLQLGMRPGERLLMPPSLSPTDRWQALIVWLFGAFSLAEVGDCEFECDSLPSAAPEEEQTVDKILGATGAFLMSECAALNDQIDMRLAVESGDPRLAIADEATGMRDRLLEATLAGQTLLRHVGRRTWREGSMSRATVVNTSRFDRDLVQVWPPVVPAPRVRLVFKGGEPLEDGERGRLERAIADAFADLIVRTRSRVAIVVDERTDAGACLPAVRELVRSRLDEVRDQARQLEIVVTAVDGRQSDPIVLPVAESADLSDHDDEALTAAIEDAARPVRRADTAVPPLLGRLECLLSALTFAAAAADPQKIIVVSDLPSAGPLDLGEIAPPTAGELLEQLDEVDVLPRLAGRAVCFVGPRETWSFGTYWSAVCGEAAIRHWTVVGQGNNRFAPVVSVGEQAALEPSLPEVRPRCDQWEVIRRWGDDLTVVLDDMSDMSDEFDEFDEFDDVRSSRGVLGLMAAAMACFFGFFSVAGFVAGAVQRMDAAVVLLVFAVVFGIGVIAMMLKPLKAVVLRRVLVGLGRAAVSTSNALDLGTPPGAARWIAKLDRRPESRSGGVCAGGQLQESTTR